jgi:hypothetical protein
VRFRVWLAITRETKQRISLNKPLTEEEIRKVFPFLAGAQLSPIVDKRMKNAGVEG